LQDGEDDEEAAPSTGSKKSGTGTFFFGGAGPKEGTATMTERTVKRKMAEEEGARGSTR
jgi:hypothetical protein